MSLDLFRPLPDGRSKGAGRRLSALPLSILVHILVVLALVVIPLLATDILPEPPREELEWTPAVPMPPTVPPPARPRPPAEAPVPAADVVPIQAPSGITPDDGLERSVATADAVPVDAGVVHGSIEGTGLGSVVVDAPPPPMVPIRPNGGRIKEPRKIVDVSPVYPDAARIARVEGIVILEAVIGPDGQVRDVRLLRSRPLLDEAAMSAVRQWRYTPTLLNGVPVPVVVTVTVNFRLQ